MARRTATRAGRTAVREGDQYLLRLPPGMRERLEQRAAETGRAMSAEVIEAIEKHLLGADRVTQLWELFGKHQENIELIPLILVAITEIEAWCDDINMSEDGALSMSVAPRVMSAWRRRKEQHDYHAYVASLPLITAYQVQMIRDLLKEIGDVNNERYRGKVNEEKFLTLMNVSHIEDIRDFAKAIELLERPYLFTDRSSAGA